jgi:DNA-binding NtrC family response regulator
MAKTAQKVGRVDSGAMGAGGAQDDLAEKAVALNQDLYFDEAVIRQRRERYKPLLLIVEDDRVTRHMLQAAMEKYCDITVAWNLQQAEYFYQSTLPNIVFLDIELPDGDGQSLAKKLCEQDDEAFVVMVSGKLNQDRVEQCMHFGVKGVVAKPAHEDKLLPLIDRYNSIKKMRVQSG